MDKAELKKEMVWLSYVSWDDDFMHSIKFNVHPLHSFTYRKVQSRIIIRSTLYIAHLVTV